MATRSTIAVQHQDGTVSQIYAHWDGYLKGGNGELLYSYYTTREQVEDLISYGDISGLASTIDDTTFYMRDRNEKDCDAHKFSSLQLFYDEHQLEEYDYLFADGLWLVKCYLTDDKFILLSEAFELTDEDDD